MFLFENHPGFEEAPILGISEARVGHRHQHIGRGVSCVTPWWEVIWTKQLLLSKIVVHLHVVGLGVIHARTPMLHLRSTLLGDISPSIPNTPVQATPWYTSSHVVPATRFTSERQEDAWEIDSESNKFNTTKQHRSSCRSTLCVTRTRLYRYAGVCDPLWLPRYPK